MAEVIQALSEVKELYEKVLGHAAPDIGSGSFAHFPPGVDPLRHALREVDYLKNLSESLESAPLAVAWVPRADTYLAKDAWVIRLEIPGVSKESLKVVVAGSECIVRGERRRPEGTETLKPLQLEWPYGPFERRIALPSSCRPEGLAARYADGVLELRVAVEVAETLHKEMKVEVA